MKISYTRYNKTKKSASHRYFDTCFMPNIGIYIFFVDANKEFTFYGEDIKKNTNISVFFMQTSLSGKKLRVKKPAASFKETLHRKDSFQMGIDTPVNGLLPKNISPKIACYLRTFYSRKNVNSRIYECIV